MTPATYTASPGPHNTNPVEPTRVSYLLHWPGFPV